MHKQEHLETLRKEVQQYCIPLRKTSRLYSFLRLSSIVIAICLAIYADQSKTSFGFILALICIVFFLCLVKLHTKIKKQLRVYEAKDEVLHKLLRRFNDTWKGDDQKDEEEVVNTVAIDLDLLGKNSLFQYLCVAATPFGKQQLKGWLLGQVDQEDAILMRQKAVAALSSNEEALLAIQTSSHLFQKDKQKFKKADFDLLLDYGKDDKKILSSVVYKGSLCMVVATFITLVLAICNVLPYGYTAICMLLNLCVCFACFIKAGSELADTNNLGKIMMDYQRIFETIINFTTQDPYCLRQQSSIKAGTLGIQKLSRIMNYVALRHNLISYVVLSTLFQLDVFILYALQTWRKNYGVALEDWLVAAGNMEALASLCVISQVKSECCFPTIVPSPTMHIDVTHAYHPLISESKAIANDFKTNEGSIIVTGSNMSGKTTFLRTLGINVMLLRAGAQVCASYMEASILQVYTSMRLQDDVSEGISTFYAELLRIRQMMDAAKQKKGMLVLIDEIFKGTNSADRILCAQTAIKKLHQPWIITLVSTHDFELCNLEKESDIQAVNYHFSEYYVEDEIHFDYTLKEGRCKTTNAQQLMKLAGF